MIEANIPFTTIQKYKLSRNNGTTNVWNLLEATKFYLRTLDIG